MFTLLAVVPRVFAGLPLICEQSPAIDQTAHWWPSAEPGVR